ncbi:MAG TPA: B12-binding domain-containing protein, partial [Gaiellaceae bacterium]|nr:B12-binding domain-containing protein [Gaiellaceae bacterium]
ELLRAWERRYGLLQPIRSTGGFRLYTVEDVERVARMRRNLDAGLSAAEAAQAAIGETRPLDALRGDTVARLLTAVRDYNGAGVHAVLDQSLAAFSLETVLRDLILPALTRVGAEWEQGTLSVSQEHFASNIIRGRLLALARLWGRGTGPLALLACAPGETHDISLVAFGLVLRTHGWRVLFFGANTPIATVIQAVEATEPALAVVTSFDPALLEQETDSLGQLAERVPLALAGPGASDELCARLGVARLDGDLVAAANEVAAGPLSPPRPR